MSAQVEAPPAAEAAPETVAAVAVETPAPKKGFLASFVGAKDSVIRLENELAAEKNAHLAVAADLAKATAELAVAQGKLAEFEALEKQLEQEAAAHEAAAAEVAAIPQKVAAGVAAAVEALGVPEASLPAAAPEPPAKGSDFGHLKGADRAAAAFNAQFATA